MNRTLGVFLIILAVIAFGALGPLRAGDITGQGMSQADLYTWLDRATRAVNNQNLTMANVSASTTAAVMVCSAATYTIDAVPYTMSAGNATFSTGTTVTVGNYCPFLLQVNAAGLKVIKQGTQVDSTTKLVYPLPDNDYCAMARFYLQASHSAFIPATSYPGVTASYVVSITKLSHYPLSLTGL